MLVVLECVGCKQWYFIWLSLASPCNEGVNVTLLELGRGVMGKEGCNTDKER